MRICDIKEIVAYCTENGCEYILNEPLSNHTSFKIGGECSIMVMPSKIPHIISIQKLCIEKQIPLFVMGNGSNMLVYDTGISGCVMLFGKNYSEITLVDETTIEAQSGVTLSALCNFALENELSGLEFAWGIPASVGGAIFMNAGAYGGEVKDVISSAKHINTDGEIQENTIETLNMTYRHTVYSNSNDIIISGVFKLKKSNKSDIKELMTDILGRRKSKQPLEYPSSGSTFKRPVGAYAAALIEECGLKGKSIGGAYVSEKHSGFLINKGNATCKDVLDLIELVQTTVYNKTGYKLECEVEIIEG